MVLEKVVAFLSDPGRVERFVTILLKGGHRVRASDKGGVARFHGVEEAEGARRLLNP